MPTPGAPICPAGPARVCAAPLAAPGSRCFGPSREDGVERRRKRLPAGLVHRGDDQRSGRLGPGEEARQQRILRTRQAQVEHPAAGADGEVHGACQRVGVAGRLARARRVRPARLERQQLRAGRHADDPHAVVGVGRHHSGDRRAMGIAGETLRTVEDEVAGDRDPPGQIGMGDVHAGIHHRDAYATPGRKALRRRDTELVQPGLESGVGVVPRPGRGVVAAHRRRQSDPLAGAQLLEHVA